LSFLSGVDLSMLSLESAKQNVPFIISFLEKKRCAERERCYILGRK